MIAENGSLEAPGSVVVASRSRFRKMSRSTVKVAISRLPGTADLPLPRYASMGAAGMDLHAAVTEPVVLQPGERALVGTGCRIALPQGYEAQVRPRSGLALNHGVGMVNSPGTVDEDYRGEIKVILINLGQEPFTIRRGDRIAQLVVAPVSRVAWLEMRDLPPTERGNGGFGSSGV